MEENNTNSELVLALNNIHAELQRINQTLSAMAAHQKAKPSSAHNDSPAPVRAREGGFARSAMSRTSSFGQETTARFAGGGKKSSDRPKGKPPAKKGDGYPKKPR